MCVPPALLAMLVTDTRHVLKFIEKIITMLYENFTKINVKLEIRP